MINEVQIDQCPQCDGTWFDHDELRKAKDGSPERTPKRPEHVGVAPHFALLEAPF